MEEEGRENRIQEFWKGVCKKDSKAIIECNTLYSAYILWCIKEKVKPVMRKDLGDFIKEQGIEKEKTRFSQYWEGLDISGEYKEELKELEHYREVEN